MKNYICIFSIILTSICTTTTPTWKYYVLPCRHTENNVFECLMQKNGKAIESDFKGLALTGNDIDFDAIRHAAHEKVKNIDIAQEDYIYTIGNVDTVTQEAHSAFLVKPDVKIDENIYQWVNFDAVAKNMKLNDPFEKGGTMAGKIENASKNRYQRKTVYASDWTKDKGLLFVAKDKKITESVSYEPNFNKLEQKNGENLIATTGIYVTGDEQAEEPKNDTRFEKYDILLTATLAVPESLSFSGKDTPTWLTNEILIKIDLFAPKMLIDRLIKLFAESLAHLAKNK